MTNLTRISANELNALVGTAGCPLLVDVRRKAAFEAEPTRIAGAVWHDHMNVGQLPLDREIIAYCVHGHNVSEIAAAKLRQAGAKVRMLEGGIEAFAGAGGVLVKKGNALPMGSMGAPSVWVTRERPKIDRIACPWLIRRFIDPLAVFHFVAAEWVKDIAEEVGGIAYDIDGVFWSHRGETCTFDTMIAEYGLKSAALDIVARIVRGADTARLDLAPEAAGLLAISLGLSRVHGNDLEQLEAGMAVYDALYAWARDGQGERHSWPAAKAKP